MTHSADNHRVSSANISVPRVILRLEGTAVLLTAVGFYAYSGFSWWAFALFLLAPDVAMAAYLINPRVGSLVYNLVHTYIFPLALAAVGWGLQAPLALQAALIWLAHIGMDRLFGYGLKYADDFKHTHFNRL